MVVSRMTCPCHHSSDDMPLSSSTLPRSNMPTHRRGVFVCLNTYPNNPKKLFCKHQCTTAIIARLLPFSDVLQDGEGYDSDGPCSVAEPCGLSGESRTYFQTTSRRFPTARHQTIVFDYDSQRQHLPNKEGTLGKTLLYKIAQRVRASHHIPQTYARRRN